jgi:hypothetical protein
MKIALASQRNAHVPSLYDNIKAGAFMHDEIFWYIRARTLREVFLKTIFFSDIVPYQQLDRGV